MAQEFEYIDPIAAAQELASKAAEEKVDVSHYFLDFSSPIPKPTPVICDPSCKDRIVVSEGNIFAIIGEAKSFKSFLASLLVIEFFKQNPTKECILIDTEQADWNVQNVAKRICDGMGWGYKDAFAKGQLKIANLRKFSKKERLNACRDIMEQCQPKLCMIDGIRDLITSVNDDVESSSVVDLMMKWSSDYNCAIGTILHTNKDGETARGHVGFELLAKCETVLLTKALAEEPGAHVKSQYHRNLPIKSFDFIINEKHVPERRTSASNDDVEELSIKCKMTAKQTYALRTLSVKANRSKDDWVNDIRIAAGVSYPTADKYFTEFVTFGVLIAVDREGHFFSHRKCEGVKQPTPQEDSQQSIDENNEAPF